jgi:hypothetical protein
MSYVVAEVSISSFRRPTLIPVLCLCEIRYSVLVLRTGRLSRVPQTHP